MVQEKDDRNSRRWPTFRLTYMAIQTSVESQGNQTGQKDGQCGRLVYSSPISQWFLTWILFSSCEDTCFIYILCALLYRKKIGFFFCLTTNKC